MSYSQGNLPWDGQLGEQKTPGNTELVDYGIYHENSDIRAHVCVAVKRLYVYPTESGIEAIESGLYEYKPAFTNINGQSIRTAEGYIVPPEKIDRCVFVPIKPFVLKRYPISYNYSTSEKGDRAVEIAKFYLSAGGFPLMVTPDVIDELDLQIEGTDIIVAANVRIQVKCDYLGGPKEMGGTGNLYLQVKECNPWRSF